jgi:uncharacterized protein (TIGR03083 family)
VALVDRVPEAAWQQPALGEWNVRELVAHANRALTLVEQYLLHPVEPVADVEAYTAPDAIEARAREAVGALGDDPAETVHANRQRVVDLVGRAAPDATVGTPFGTLPLVQYLTSRTAELTIHGVDLAHAIAVSPVVPADALGETLRFIAATAVRRGEGVRLVRALSGREPLPPDFSVF